MMRYCLGIIAMMAVVLSTAKAVAALSSPTTAKAGRQQQGNKYSSMKHRMDAPRHLHTTRTLMSTEIPPLVELDAFSSSSQTCDSHAGRCPFVKRGSTLNSDGFAPTIPISGMCGGYYYIIQDVTPGFVFPVRALSQMNSI